MADTLNENNSRWGITNPGYIGTEDMLINKSCSFGANSFGIS